MLKCPYCFEVLPALSQQCPHCRQFFIDSPLESEFKSIEKKNCIFCGKKILKEARVCRHCQKWIDSVDDAASDYDKL